MPTHRDIAAFIETLAPPPGRDEGFRFGDAKAETTGILVCFMATLEALAEAAGRGCNLVVCHEELHYPYTAFGGQPLEDSITWTTNRLRYTALAQHGLAVYRAHGQADRFCILDAFAEKLGMPAPAVREGYFRIYDIEPVTVADLAADVKARVGQPFLRVSGDLSRVVSRVGAPWYDPDVLIAGECDEYAFRYTEDAGVPMIETGHSISENPGLERFATTLRAQFPQVPVVFHTVPCPWRTV
jgi:putative NIF3 family GTP cyclohydrolase 1 type 2